MNNNNTLLDPGLPATCPACWGDCRMPNGEPCLACQGGMAALVASWLADPVPNNFLDLVLTRTAPHPRPRVVRVSTPRGRDFLPLRVADWMPKDEARLVSGREVWRLVGLGDQVPAGAVRATLSHPMGSMGEEVPAPVAIVRDELERAE